MKTADTFTPTKEPPGQEKKVTVTVEYTGRDPYVEQFTPEVPVGTIERKALHAFGLEPSAADK